MDLLRPYLLLACVAFFIGFASYVAVGRVLTPIEAPQESWQAPIQASVPDAQLADGKEI